MNSPHPGRNRPVEPRDAQSASRHHAIQRGDGTIDWSRGERISPKWRMGAVLLGALLLLGGSVQPSTFVPTDEVFASTDPIPFSPEGSEHFCATVGADMPFEVDPSVETVVDDWYEPYVVGLECWLAVADEEGVDFELEFFQDPQDWREDVADAYEDFKSFADGSDAYVSGIDLGDFGDQALLLHSQYDDGSGGYRLFTSVGNVAMVFYASSASTQRELDLTLHAANLVMAEFDPDTQARPTLPETPRRSELLPDLCDSMSLEGWELAADQAPVQGRTEDDGARCDWTGTGSNDLTTLTADIELLKAVPIQELTDEDAAISRWYELCEVPGREFVNDRLAFLHYDRSVKYGYFEAEIFWYFENIVMRIEVVQPNDSDAEPQAQAVAVSQLVANELRAHLE
ncbi:hypothetical protein [Glycomyces buryatensis]|uniref:DUF3558 domain-containing protein n=1 Tax=Glycomyces buryatensis TaxID=2570927 RepID=A0A4S8QLY5_9ACTN|nr:hypothetical protein [Glycomyces buryatensis]THV42409.1 hypothetical protein FAB82_07080 [Glycomyces buryatensis]